MQLSHGAGHLLALLGAEPLHAFHAIEHALALLRRHGVELLQSGADAGLLLWRQLIEAGLAFQGLLLLLWREILVLLHPLAEVAGRAGIGALSVGGLATDGLAVAIDGWGGAEGWLLIGRGVELLRLRSPADYGRVAGLRGSR